MLVVTFTAVTAAGQTWTPARTPDGQPDMQGIWATRGARMATYSLEGGGHPDHLALTGLSTDRKSVIVDPADGIVPYQPWAAAKRKDISDNHTNPRSAADIDPMAKCFLPGTPRMNYQSQFQILQTPGHVIIHYEFNHAYRVIPLDGRPRLPQAVKLWMGDSRGRWEGNTLVVETSNHTDRTWFDIIGTFHSDALRVVERWTLADADTITYEASIEDPQVFTRPWKMAFTFARNKEPGFELFENACFEGERSIENMLAR